MTNFFADTSYYVALLNPADAAHESAASLIAQVRGDVVTTSWVLIELANLLARPPARQLYVEFVRELRLDPFVQIIAPDEELFEAGFDLFAVRQDKQWSLTDCISFIVMQRHRITDALTTDHHFAQAGFNVLLK